MEDRKTEIEGVMLMEFLRSVEQPINYTTKYNLAVSLLELRGRREAIKKIEFYRKEVEKKCGYPLHILQDILFIAYSWHDLSTIYHLPNKKAIKKVYELKNELEEFRNNITNVVIKEICKGGVIFG